MVVLDYMAVLKISPTLVYLCGGINKAKNEISTDIGEYNPVNNSFSPLQNMR